jgi:hypothetical protein
MVCAYEVRIRALIDRWLKPRLHRLGNEVSAALKIFLTQDDISFQLAPYHMHRRNAAEYAIQTSKHHFSAVLCYPNFHLKMWNKLFPQATITLNLLRQS